MTDNILKKLGFSSRGATQSRETRQPPKPPPVLQPPPVPQLVVLQPPITHISRQLIVGVDFVSSFAAGTLKNTADQRHQGTTFSSVAFALVTDQGVKEGIITEWPGARNMIMPKV